MKRKCACSENFSKQANDGKWVRIRKHTRYWGLRNNNGEYLEVAVVHEKTMMGPKLCNLMELKLVRVCFFESVNLLPADHVRHVNESISSPTSTIYF